MMSEFFDDESKITYPQADRLVDKFVTARGDQRSRATSQHVLEWADVPDTHHNKHRINDALRRVCQPLDTDWAGRTVFQLPRDYNQDR